MSPHHIRPLSLPLRSFSLRPPPTVPRAHHPRLQSTTPLPSNGMPFMSRKANRPLPEIPHPGRRWARTLPIFFAIVTLSAVGIFNYQKSSSSVVSATLYALRTSPMAREVLGDEIYFRDKVPWIWGELNQLHGRIDVRFGVKGKKARGMMRFRSLRKERMGYFETQEWSLTMEDGRVIQLLLEERSDPFKNTKLAAGADPSNVLPAT